MKTKVIFACSACGYQSAKWLGRCPDCLSWNSFAEETFAQSFPYDKKAVFAGNSAAVEPVLLKDIKAGSSIRTQTGISELDRILGGGLVKGAVVLLGGDPGIGKSTLSLQITLKLARQKQRVLYVSGEESVEQTKIRAQRLGGLCGEETIYIVNQTDISLIAEYIKKIQPQTIIIDSIQVVFSPQIPSGCGTVSQVRECANILTNFCKAQGISAFIIGHVTKEGLIAGPRVLEHIVDCVLYFEGDRFSSFRILRAVKNRFGSTNEIAVLRMEEEGLAEVKNPSEIFLSERPEGISGSIVTSVLQGTRPIFFEIQALVSRNFFGGYPARRSEGFDYNRLNLIIAILEKRVGLHLENQDVFINVVGGLKVTDPSCDLAVAMAIVSCFKDKIIKKDTLIIGELGLASEVRSVVNLDLRINEAVKVGFKKCLLPANNLADFKRISSNQIELIGVKNVAQAMEAVF